MSRHDDLQMILRWCRTHSRAEFTYTDVGIHPLKLKGFSTAKFRGKIWVVSAGKVESKDGSNGLRKYRLATRVG
jgi:hypothetical protein